MTVTRPTRRKSQWRLANSSDSFLLPIETLDAVASLTAKLALLGLPNGYFDQYRQTLVNSRRHAPSWSFQGSWRLAPHGLASFLHTDTAGDVPAPTGHASPRRKARKSADP